MRVWPGGQSQRDGRQFCKMINVARKRKSTATEDQPRLAMFLVPCSCGTTFSVSRDYDQHGGHIRSYLPCPNFGKRHDPRNRLLQLGYEAVGFWTIDKC